jgi:hypothetical protein
MSGHEPTIQRGGASRSTDYCGDVRVRVAAGLGRMQPPEKRAQMDHDESKAKDGTVGQR